jgi:glucose-1-phosphate thymidylyltransferase|tara:strand:- start:2709 stop:3590 length:882 start_codon:yes stop_codon:yes gene_type:complete
MKGIILAGGTGSRLYPLTKAITKQLIPVYNKPMIYYPLSTLMLAGIKDILIICKEQDLKTYNNLFGTGQQVGINISYEIQHSPNGIAESFIIGEEFIGEDDVCLILGDNIFHGNDLGSVLESSVNVIERNGGAIIYGYHVNNPQDYGVIGYNKKFKVTSIVEKPHKPKSNCAAVGIYMYDNSVIEIAKNIEPSERSELEITSVNNFYLKKGQLKLERLGRGYAWFDAGSSDSLLKASNFVKTIEARTGLKIACIEEVAYYKNFIDKQQLLTLTEDLKKSEYGKYLLGLLEENE